MLQLNELRHTLFQTKELRHAPLRLQMLYPIFFMELRARWLLRAAAALARLRLFFRRRDVFVRRFNPRFRWFRRRRFVYDLARLAYYLLELLHAQRLFHRL